MKIVSLGRESFSCFVVTLAALMAPALLHISIAQGAMPSSVQIDLIKADILDDVKSNKFQAALSKFDDLRKLEPHLAPPLLFLEAKVADNTGDSLRVVDTLTEYFNQAGREDKNYAAALTLVRRNQRNANIARAEKAAKDQAKLDRIFPGLVMVPIPAGSYRMGDASGNGGDGEKPVHNVSLKPFRLSAHDVTFDQFDKFAVATGRPLPGDQGWGRGNRPVINVNWDDAKAFIAWLNQQSSIRFRLPTEAEWEYAARAGTTTDYYWGAAASHEQANYGSEKCCEGLAQGRDQWVNTSPVGSFPPNPWGLYDMLGNVWQWTEDCWNESYSSAPADGSPWLAGACTRRVRRGGSWFSTPTGLRVSYRNGIDTAYRDNYLGFRLAQDP
jgi:formylglycine-generating enzyme required for sulfatase activity